MPVKGQEGEKAKFEEVINIVKKSAKFLSEKGEEGFSEINDPEGPWVKEELYVFVYGLKGDKRGVIIAHPREGLVGKNFLRVKDSKGKIFAAEFLRIAESEAGEGWSEYWWPKLKNSKPEVKLSYIMKVSGRDMLVGVGLYGGRTKEDVLKLFRNTKK
ncbi:MAG: cache type 2 domain-containing protein [Desulfobacteraceae bacterium]|nr:cache type 2 domain-containing protein [Desulfobacteraceae bacterium]